VKEERLEDKERRPGEEERVMTEKREEEERAREERRYENKAERRHTQHIFIMVIGSGLNAVGGDKKRKKQKRGNTGNQRGSSAE